MPEKIAQLNIRIDPQLKEAAERAASRDHRSLTSFIEKLIIDFVGTEADLSDWQTKAVSKFKRTMIDIKSAQGGFIARSYLVRSKTGQTLKPNKLLSVLDIAHGNLGDLISSPHIFYPYTSADLKPNFTYDLELRLGNFDEILECAAKIENNPSFWRFSPLAMGTDIRPHWEDIANVEAPKNVRWFAPYHFTHHLAEIVLHALVLSEQLKDADNIEFRCEWTGLAERQLAKFDHSNSFQLLGKMAHADSRITSGAWDIKYLRQDWPEVVATLGAPVMRLFDPNLDYSARIVRDLIPHLQRY